MKLYKKILLGSSLFVGLTTNIYGQTLSVESKDNLVEYIVTDFYFVDHQTKYDSLINRIEKLKTPELQYKIEREFYPLNKTKFQAIYNPLTTSIKQNINFITDLSLNLLSKKQIKSIYNRCDSVDAEGYDEKGNIYMIKKTWCDSTAYLLNGLVGLTIYEKWIFNNNNGMIEKKILAFSPLYCPYEKRELGPMNKFLILTNKESYAELKKYYRF